MRFTDSPYEDFMKEKSYFKGVPPNLPPKGSRCDGCPYWRGIGCVEMSRNVQSGNTQNLKSMVIQRSFPKWSVAERRKTAAASNQAACCACTHSRYLAGGSPSGLRV